MNELIERYLDNAATCSQERGMLDDGALRECVRMNVVNPLQKRIATLEATIDRVKALEPFFAKGNIGSEWVSVSLLREALK